QQTINIEEAPTTSFSFNNTCNGTTTTFTDQTTGTNLASWNWDFGDGTTSTTQSPTHTYANPGKYAVTLNVANNLGCTTTKVDTVYNHSLPVVNFTNNLPCSTTPIQFTDQSLVDNANLVAWEWDFGDETTSTDQHPEHLYGQTGIFEVKLKSFSQFGCTDSTQTIITVAQGPEVDFAWDKSCEGEATTFTDLTNSFGITITNWNWIIDGVLHTSQNPNYTFTNSGTYTVQLTVAVNNLCTQTLMQDIIIEVPPTVQFDYNEGCGGSGTEFYDLTALPNDTIIAREWRVDGAIISSDSVATISLDPGNYDITLSVVTNAGCTESATSTISLIGSPVAAYEVNANYGAINLLVDFTNFSTGGNDYLWSFNDANNSTSTEQNPNFIFTDIGEYNVTLRTSSSPDCYDETTQLITVVEPLTNVQIIAITPVLKEDKTTFILTLENTGTTIINNSTSLVFRADYGTEVVEPLNTILYAGKTINYTPAFAIASSSTTDMLCVKLLSAAAIPLDEKCVTLGAPVIISEPYPNPSSGNSTIDVILEDAQEIKVRVINRAGQPVFSNIIKGVTGLNKMHINGITLPQGLYIIEIKVGKERELYKISITR
ncbi:Cell surface protein, partial [hydrothermal vent metagenome]